MKKKYERPVLIKNLNGFSNKFGYSHQVEIKDNIDNILIKKLVENYGSPIFVFSEKDIRDRYHRYLNAFKRGYPKVSFAWSYKTNYLGAICSIYHQEGSVAEVVSEYEYKKAKELGADPDKIIYNGPYKSENSLKEAIQDGARIHIDHFEELSTLEKLSDEMGKKPRVAIRVHMDSGIYPLWSRFGFDYENGEAKRALKRIIEEKKMELIGLHTHIGTFILSPEAYVKALRKLIDLYKWVESEYGITLEYIDLGGGFPSKNRLKAQYLPPSIAIPPIELYAEKIVNELLEHFSYSKGPQIYFETGRALIDEAGYLITSVHAAKRLPDNRRALILDAGVHLLYPANFYDIPVYPAQKYDGVLEPTILYGPLCMNIDVLRESVQLPYMSPKDSLVFHPVGAYGVTQWMQFIHFRPAVLLIGVNGEIDIIRRAEKMEDITTPEFIPERVRLFEE